MDATWIIPAVVVIDPLMEHLARPVLKPISKIDQPINTWLASPKNTFQERVCSGLACVSKIAYMKKRIEVRTTLPIATSKV